MAEIVFFAFNPHDSISSSVGSTLMKWIKGSMVQGLVETLTIFSINYSVQFFYCILNNCCNNDVYNLHVGRHFSLLLVAFFSRMIQHFHVGNLEYFYATFCLLMNQLSKVFLEIKLCKSYKKFIVKKKSSVSQSTCSGVQCPWYSNIPAFVLHFPCACYNNVPTHGTAWFLTFFCFFPVYFKAIQRKYAVCMCDTPSNFTD